MRRWLLVILVVGGVLRIAPLLWGHPILPYHRAFNPDEPKAYKATATSPRSYLTDERFLAYGNTIPATVGTVLRVGVWSYAGWYFSRPEVVAQFEEWHESLLK